MEIKESHPDCFSQLEYKLKELNGQQGKVGFFEDQQYEDGTPLADVAAKQELGFERIPPRPFMRPAQTKNKDKWNKTAGFAAKRILEGKMSGRDGMLLLAEQAAGDVVKAIRDVTMPPLSETTIFNRRHFRPDKPITMSTKPLIDTGRMVDQVRAIVEET